MIFGIHRKKKRKTTFNSLDISVEIPALVVRRIHSTISSSNSEEGGKFIGYVFQNNEKILLKVMSYIDSGPRVNNSKTHLFPNGEYQEKVFRLIETFDSKIEHIGSWHSHHCNQFAALSNGDIIGYKNSVNNQNYNLDYFFVLLVNGLSGNNLIAKYYLFCRGQDDYLELCESNIRLTKESYHYEKIIKSSEEFSLDDRSKTIASSNNLGHNKSIVKDSFFNKLREVRAKDQKWLNQKFSAVTAFRNKKNNEIGWKWEVFSEGKKLKIRYIHPSSIKIDSTKLAQLEIKYNSKIILEKPVPLDDDRFHKIENYIIQALEIVKDFNRKI